MRAQFSTELHEGRPVYRLAWVEVERLLGRPHHNTVRDDARLASALRAAGARPTGRSYSAADGWHAYAPQGTRVEVRATIPQRNNPRLARAVGTGRGRQTAASRFASQTKAARAQAKVERAKLGRKKPEPTPGPCGEDELRERAAATEQAKTARATCRTRPKAQRAACRTRATEQAKGRRARARGACMSAREDVRARLRATLDDIARRRAERAAQQQELRATRRKGSEKQRAAARKAATKRRERGEEALWKDVPPSVWDDPVLRAEWEREGPRFVRAARERKAEGGRQRIGAWELALETRPEMYAAAYPPDEWSRHIHGGQGPGEYFEAQERAFERDASKLAEAEEAYYRERAEREASAPDDAWMDDPFAEFFEEPAA